MTEPKTNTLEVPGAVLAFDVRSNDSGTEPALLMIASPMGAAGFETLSGYFTDRTVITYDPRGGAQHTHRRCSPVHARRACRRPAPAHILARSRTR